MFEKEIQQVKLEKEAIEHALSAEKMEFADKLKNGLGDDIINNITRHAYQSKKKNIFKIILDKLFRLC